MTEEEEKALDFIFYDGQPVFQDLCHVHDILDSTISWQKNRTLVAKSLNPKKNYSGCTGKRLAKDEVKIYDRLKRIRRLVSSLITTMENQC